MGKTPKPPNPYAQGAAQQSAELGASMGSSVISNPNVYTPYGSQTYSLAGYETVYDAQGRPQHVPRYNQQQTLSPDQQRLLGLQTQQQYNMGQTGVQASSKLRDLMGKNVSSAGWQAWNAGPQAAQLATAYGGNNPMTMAIGNQEVRQDTGPTDRAAIENAMMGSYNRQVAPQQAAENAQLAARGLSPGGAGYGRVQQGREDAFGEQTRQAYLASGNEARQAQQAYNQAAAQRLQQAGAVGEFQNQAQQQAYQQAMQRAGFSNDALQQMYAMQGQTADRANTLRGAQAGEALGLRNQSLNEIMALMQGSQVTAPQFNPYSAQGIGAAPVGSYMGQNYANQAAASAQKNAGLFGLGGAIAGGIGSAGGPMAFLGMSDRRLKQDIVPLDGMQLAGVPLYRFRYIEDPRAIQVGVMSDEVRPLHPDAVIERDGYDMVDYGLLLSRHGGHQDGLQ